MSNAVTPTPHTSSGLLALVEPGALLGTHCVIGAGAYVASGAVLADHVTVEPRALILSTSAAGDTPTRIGHGALIGANATITAGVSIGAGAQIRPGSVVTRDVPPAAIVEGNPGNIVGYVGTTRGPLAPIAKSASAQAIEDTPVGGVTVHRFPVITDIRGSLTVGEFESHIPFKPLRYFMVFDVPNQEIRGEHAHHECHQFLVCVRGRCSVVADDGSQRVEVELDRPSIGVYLPPRIWGIQYKYSSDALLLVFASHHYDPADYIRNYDEFIRLTRAST